MATTTLIKQISLTKDGKYLSSKIISKSRRSTTDLESMVHDFIRFSYGQIALDSLTTYLPQDQAAFDQHLVQMTRETPGFTIIRSADRLDQIYLYQRSIETVDRVGYIYTTQVTEPVVTLLSIFEAEEVDDDIPTLYSAPQLKMIYVGKTSVRIPVACDSTPHLDMLAELRASAHFQQMRSFETSD